MAFACFHCEMQTQSGFIQILFKDSWETSETLAANSSVRASLSNSWLESQSPNLAVFRLSDPLYARPLYDVYAHCIYRPCFTTVVIVFQKKFSSTHAYHHNRTSIDDLTSMILSPLSLKHSKLELNYMCHGLAKIITSA